MPEKSVLSFSQNNEKLWVNLNHGGFDDCEQYLYPNTEILIEDPKEFTLYVFGHTHHPMIKKYKNHIIFNPGSIGQPRDWDPRASYASFDMLNNQITIHRLEYDVVRYQAVLYEKNISEDMIKILQKKRGKD